MPDFGALTLNNIMLTQYGNRIRVLVTSTGTGTAELGQAVPGFLTFASIPTGSIVGYAIDDGSNWEVGTGVYTAATGVGNGPPGTVSRDTIEASTSGTDRINLSGNAQMMLTQTAAQIAALAPIESPAFTGIPTAPTAPVNTSTTQIATTEFISNVTIYGGIF